MVGLKPTRLLTFGLAVSHQSWSTGGAPSSGMQGCNDYPKQTIAGVAVVDTPLVRAAQSFVRDHSSDFVYKHIMRSWLFGALMIDANETLRDAVDLEVHAVAAILHDLGWDRAAESPFISSDRRFEVDGAIAARGFIQGHEDGKHWDRHRLQLVWDAIALHTERSIAYYKELDVQVVSAGIAIDFTGPGSGVTEDKFAAVVEEFPRSDLKNGVNDTIIWLCQTKPSTTYDTWMQPWGDRYVANFPSKGNQRIDNIFANL